MTLVAYRDQNLYFGDIHNHCGLSYGKGSLAEAFANARLQLDFASVTVHGHWDDLPENDPRLGYLVDYHRHGFQKAATAWPQYVQDTNAANVADVFVTFPSFEWHSMEYGDHCMYFRDSAPEAIYHVADVTELRECLRQHGSPAMMIPHHIGYKQGFRGINWSAFSTEFSPVVEMMSFHGCAEHSEAEPEYLHAMGPRAYESTMQYALACGHVFGVVGSTDHHSAHPGTYGYGLMGAWANALTREAIWDAIVARRTFAVSGDRIALEFALNEHPMGQVIAPTHERWLDVATRASTSIDYIDILCNNRVIHRESVLQSSPDYTRPVKILLEMGWGEAEQPTDWAVNLVVHAGQLLGVEPQLRGHDVGVPLSEDDACAFSEFSFDAAEGHITLVTQTPRNPTVTSAATQRLVLEILGTPDTCITGTINQNEVNQPLSALEKGAQTTYLAGFVSPAFVFHRAVPEAEYAHRVGMMHHAEHESSGPRDWYYVRVRQKNGHWAWSSPIWVDTSVR